MIPASTTCLHFTSVNLSNLSRGDLWNSPIFSNPYSIIQANDYFDVSNYSSQSRSPYLSCRLIIPLKVKSTPVISPALSFSIISTISSFSRVLHPFNFFQTFKQIRCILSLSGPVISYKQLMILPSIGYGLYAILHFMYPLWRNTIQTTTLKKNGSHMCVGMLSVVYINMPEWELAALYNRIDCGIQYTRHIGNQNIKTKLSKFHTG